MNWPDDFVNQIIQGNTKEIMKQMPDESVHCVITSPPYFGLRDYGLEPRIWGGRENCEHVWGNEIKHNKGSGGKTEKQVTSAGSFYDATSGQFCQLCGAWRGSLGLEPSPELYVAHLVEICREIKRVLRKDGVLLLNLGDSYWGGKGKSSQAWSTANQNRKTLQKSQHQICGMGETRPADGKNDTVELRNDLTPEEIAYVFSELAKCKSL